MVSVSTTLLIRMDSPRAPTHPSSMLLADVLPLHLCQLGSTSKRFGLIFCNIRCKELAHGLVGSGCTGLKPTGPGTRKVRLNL